MHRAVLPLGVDDPVYAWEQPLSGLESGLFPGDRHHGPDALVAGLNQAEDLKDIARQIFVRRQLVQVLVDVFPVYGQNKTGTVGGFE